MAVCNRLANSVQYSRLIVGEIGFKGIQPNGEVELGYSTRHEHRCRGIMTEAVNEICRFASGRTGSISKGVGFDPAGKPGLRGRSEKQRICKARHAVRKNCGY